MAAPNPAGWQSALVQADAAYEPISTFADWVPSAVDLAAWDEALAQVQERRAIVDSATSDAVLRTQLRAAAVDTGALEGLYDADRGFTMSVAEQVISMDQAEVEKGPGFRRNFEAQLEGFHLALDLATARRPVTEVVVRQLHEVTCAGQPTYRVLTAHGVQSRELQLGAYKTEPNHVQLPDGSYHAYAPVREVGPEMARLVGEIRGQEFEAAHPVLQAAYVHHAFTRVHPFPDGNGRVARLLSSVWLLRGASIPLWIEAGARDGYLAALRAADAGKAESFIDEIARRSLAMLRELAAELASAPVEAELRHRDLVRAGRENLGAALAARLTEHAPGRVTTLSPKRSRTLPKGLEFGDRQHATEVRPHRRPRYWLDVAIDWDASPLGRFVVASGSLGQRGDELEIRERFDEAEVLPDLSASARRRLDHIVRRVIADASIR